MDILHLRYFSKVYETLNYTRAAEELFISRQALRQVIHNLEGELGYRLFVNKKNSLLATDRAKGLYMDSRAALSAFGELEDKLCLDPPARERPTIRLGLITNIHNVFTEDEILKCHGRQSPFNIIRISGSCAELREKVKRGDIDTAILFGSGEEAGNLEIFPIYRQRKLYLMVNRNHPLGARDWAAVEDLKGEPFISQGSGYDVHEMLEKQCRQAGFVLNVEYTIEDTLGIVSYVQSNKGISYSLTDRIHHFSAPEVVCLPFRETSMNWSAYRIFLRDSRRKGLVCKFWEYEDKSYGNR